MRVKKLPQILALHLKRFKYMEHLNRYIKVSYRVVFPLELRLFNTVSGDCDFVCLRFVLFLSYVYNCKREKEREVCVCVCACTMVCFSECVRKRLERGDWVDSIV